MSLFLLEREYTDYLLVERGFADSTVYAYCAALRAFNRFLINEYGYVPAPERVELKHLRRFLSYLKTEKSNRAGSRNRKLAALASYYLFLEDIDYLDEDDNPIRLVRRAREERPLPVYLTLQEAKRLLSAAKISPLASKRNYALMQFLLQTGCRAGEVVELKLGHIDLREANVRIFGKGAKERLVPLTQNTVKALEDYLEIRQTNDQGSTRLFVGHAGGAITNTEIGKIFQQLCRQARIDKPNLTVMKLRHTCLTLLLRAGVDLISLKKIAGHSRVRSTAVYLHVTLSDVREAIKKHPLG